MIRGSGDWLGPLAKVPAALANGADPNHPLGPGGPTLVEAALVAPQVFRAMLEAGADPNVTSDRGWPVLLEVLAERGVGDGKPLAKALVAHGARWDALATVSIGHHQVTLPVLLALSWTPRIQLDAVFYALELWGADPGITDQWGGNVAHHMAHQCYHQSRLERLGKLGVDMGKVAEIDSDELAWAKLLGDWVPGFAGLTPMETWRKYWGKP